MNRPRLVAALVVMITLIGLVALANLADEHLPESVALPEPLTTTTEEPNYSALVRSGVISIPSPTEEELTEKALERRTSTTSTTVAPTTTTTTVSSTTSTAASPVTTTPPTTTATTAPPTTAPTTTSAGGYVASAENDFASRINSYRSSSGLSGLQRDGSLDSYARSWAKKMGESGDLSHSSIGSLLPPWSAAGENVGFGGSVSVIFDALVGSSTHSSNMVGDWTHMGIGVWRDASGALWTCHVFTR